MAPKPKVGLFFEKWRPLFDHTLNQKYFFLFINNFHIDNIFLVCNVYL